MKSILDGIKLGASKIKVFKRETNEQTKKETIRQVHSGVAIAATNKFLKVFCPLPAPKNEGDAGQDSAQFYPIESRNMWCELDGELSKPLAILA